ncbi:MAG: MFS transporter, partial [Acidimicrobiales bacterium]
MTLVTPTPVEEGATVPAEPVASARDDEGRGLRALLRDARDYSILRQSPYGLRPLLVLGGISFFQRFDSAAFSVAGPDIARDLNISVSDIIGIQTLVGTVAILATLVAGYYADRTRRIPYLAVGTFLSGVFSAITGRGRSFAGIAGPRVVDDAADTAAGVPSLSLLGDYYPDEVRGKAFAFLGNLRRAGSLLAPIVAGYAVTRFGWGSSFIA